MGLRLCEDKVKGVTCFYCSSSMVAFGPVFEDSTEASEFLNWLTQQDNAVFNVVFPVLANLHKDDPRSYTDADLSVLYQTFLNDYKYHERNLHGPDVEAEEDL